MVIRWYHNTALNEKLERNKNTHDDFISKDNLSLFFANEDNSLSYF